MTKGTNLLIEELKGQAEKNGLSKAVVANDFTFNYKTLDNYVAQIAKRLRDIGIQPGQVVATKLPLALDWLISLSITHEAAISYSAYVGRPLNSSVSVDWLICLREENDSIPPGKTIVLDNSWLGSITNTPANIEPMLYPSEASLMRIATTSGTTGEPKAFGAKVGALWRMASDVAKYLPTRTKALALVGLPALNSFWGYYAKLIRGETQFLVMPKDGRFWEVLLSEKIELVSGTPQQIANLFDVIESQPEYGASIEEARLFGATPPPSLIKRLIQSHGLRVHITYGMTEIGMVSVTEAKINQDNRLLGEPIPGLQVRIGQQDSYGVGRLELKPAFEVSGYLGNSEATAKHFNDGWFIPGDLVELSQEGVIRFIGRGDDVVNLGGEKYSLDLIDSVLSEVDGIQDVGSFAVSISEKNQIHIAYVSEKEFALQDLNSLLDSQLPGIAISGIYKIPVLPRTNTGKIIRRELEALVREPGK